MDNVLVIDLCFIEHCYSFSFVKSDRFPFHENRVVERWKTERESFRGKEFGRLTTRANVILRTSISF